MGATEEPHNYWKEDRLFLEDGRACKYSHDILGADYSRGRVFSTYDENTYDIQLLLFRCGNPESNIGIKAIGIASEKDYLLFEQRLWDKRYFEQTGKKYEDK